MSKIDNESYKKRLLIDSYASSCMGNLKLNNQNNFKWEYNERFSCTTSRELDSFFKLLVRYNCNDELRDKNDIDEYFEMIKERFFDDIVIEVLMESVEELIKQLKSKVSQRKYNDLINELFFSVTKIDSKIQEVYFREDLKKKSYYNFDNDIKNGISKLYKLNNSEFLKIITPWILFVLSLTSDKREKDFIKLYKHFKLVNPKYGDRGEVEVYNNIRKSFNLFMYILAFDKNSNKSLCLNFLNKYTNFFDIDNLVKNYKLNSYGDLENENNENLIKRFKFITKVDSFSVKDMLIKSPSSFYLLNNTRIWEKYSLLFNECKGALKDSIEDLSERRKFGQELPPEIRSNYAIYKLFSDEDPFYNIIEEIVEDREEQFSEEIRSIDEKQTHDTEYISELERIVYLQKNSDEDSVIKAYDLLIEKVKKDIVCVDENMQKLKEEKSQSLFKDDYTLPNKKIKIKLTIEDYENAYQMIYNEKDKK